MNKEKLYVYPHLMSNVDFGFVRIGGNGLANCMFVVARAVIEARRLGLSMISPTWAKLSIGPFIRREKDKRTYFGLFRSRGISGMKKILLLLFFKKRMICISGLGEYFEPLIKHQEDVKLYFDSIVCSRILKRIDQTHFQECVGVHVRLGDYASDSRTNIDWYVSIVMQIHLFRGDLRFYLFSDGTDEELSSLLNLPFVEKIFLGSAIGDIYALSRCKMIVGSDSTFSGWAAYLGQVPILFQKRHYGRVLVDQSHELKVENNGVIPDSFLKLLNVGLNNSKSTYK